MIADGPLGLVVLAFGAVGGAALFVAFVGLERRRRPEVVVGIVLAALIAQMMFYRADSQVPVGLFRPGPLRLPEVLIGTAVAARVWHRGIGLKYSASGLAIGAFLAWYATLAVVGVLEHNPRSELLFQARLIVYLGGTFVLAAGVPPSRLVDIDTVRTVFAGVAAIVGLQALLALGFIGSAGPFTPPGANGASLYLGVALVVLFAEVARRPSRPWVMAATVPMALTPLLVAQRASVVHFVVAGAVLAFALFGRTRRRRRLFTPTQFALVFAGLAALGIIANVRGLETGTVLPAQVQTVVDDTFGGVGNVQSAEARVNKWDEGRKLFGESPLVGSGLGKQFTSFRPGVGKYGRDETAGVFDNVIMDLLVRGGVPALALFLVAMAFVLRDAWLVWREHADPVVAAAGLAIAAWVAGFIAKATVESVLDKVPLACALGLVAGIVAAAARETRAARRDAQRDAIEWSGAAG